jgi:hypothetical protein
MQVNEGSDAVIGVTLEGIANEAITVNYETVDGTTEIDKDYLPVQGELTWQAGETGEKAFSIAILQDNVKESDEDLYIHLTQLRGQATFGEASVKITILSNTVGSCIDEELINCDVTNKDLDNVTITQGTTVTGGRLSGDIHCFGVLRDIVLAPDAKIFGQGCTLEGSVDSQDPTRPGMVTKVDISADTTLRNVLIGKGSIVDPEVIIGENVFFEDNFSIPTIDLSDLLGYSDQSVLGQRAVRLLQDFLIDNAPNGILDAINGIYELESLGLKLIQHPDTGMLYVDVQNVRYAVLPIKVQQILRQQIRSEAERMGMKVFGTDEITFTTHSGREIITYPVIQSPDVFEQALADLGLHLVSVEEGNLKVQATDESYFVARPALFSEVEANAELAEGIYTDRSGLVKFLFTDETPQLRYQWLYPAAADPTALMALSSMQLTADGRVQSDDYAGMLSYLVRKGAYPSSEQTQVLEIEDQNGDGFADFDIVYPNGDAQVMLQIGISP